MGVYTACCKQRFEPLTGSDHGAAEEEFHPIKMRVIYLKLIHIQFLTDLTEILTVGSMGEQGHNLEA